MNESIFHNSKLQNQLLKVSEKLKIHFLQFTKMRLLLTTNKLMQRGATPILMESLTKKLVRFYRYIVVL